MRALTLLVCISLAIVVVAATDYGYGSQARSSRRYGARSYAAAARVDPRSRPVPRARARALASAFPVCTHTLAACVILSGDITNARAKSTWRRTRLGRVWSRCPTVCRSVCRWWPCGHGRAHWLFRWQYRVVRSGTGRSPRAGDKVKVHCELSPCPTPAL